MVNVNSVYPDFSAGEVSPKLYGRVDIAAFFNGARRVQNFITNVTGSASYRTGTIYAAKTRGNTEAFLYTFRYTEALSYILEFTDQKLRFYRNSGRVHHAAQNITAVTNANPAVVTYAGSDTYENGDRVFITDVVGMTELNGNEYIVANRNTGANTFELSGVNSTAYGTYVSGGAVEEIYEITTPFLAADLFELKFAQVGANMYIAHPSYNPQVLNYQTATSWSITDHSPTALTLTADNRPGAVGLYEQRLIYGGSNNSPNTLWFSKSANFGNFTTGTAVTDGITYTIAGAVNKISWLEGTTSFLAIGGFSDVFQATGGQEAVITPTSISIRPTNSFGVANIMPSSKGTQILYLQGNNLIIRSFEYNLQAGAYKPVDMNTIADHITSSGVKQIAYQEGRPNVLWAVKNNGILVGMTIEDSESISGWHRHTTQGEVVSVATTPRADDYDQVWVCVKRTIEGVDTYYIEFFSDVVNYPRREDYVEGTETVDKDTWENLLFEAQKQYIHVDSSISYYGDDLGIAADVSITPAAVTGSTINFTASGAIFTSDMVGREIWRKSVTGVETGRALITSYTSSTVVVCDVLIDFDSTSTIPAGEWFLTAGTLSGLDHLEGKTVSVVADGGQHAQVVVTDGEITFERQSSTVHVGLSYNGYLETNDLETPVASGTVQTKKKNVYAVGFRFLDTLYAKYGTSYYKLNQIEMRTSDMRMDRPPILFTGDVKESYVNETNENRRGGWSREKRVIVSQDQPYPCNVQLIIPYYSVSA